MNPITEFVAGEEPNPPVFVEPGSPEWMQIITPSKVAAILGVSRWESPYRLWHRLKGLVDPEPPKDIFDMGHDFEPAMAAIWKRRNPGWQLSPGEVQIIAPDKFGYPAAATLDRRARRGRARKVIEFKTARHLEDWGDFFTDQAPADYVAQILAQMAYTGYTKHPAELLVLGPYFEAHTYVIHYDADVVAMIHQRCTEFWHSLKGKFPPDLDDSVATYQCVRELHPDITPGETVQVDPDLAVELLAAAADSKDHEARLRGLKTELLDRMRNAQYACVGDLRIADRRPHAKGSVALNLATKNLPQLEELRTA
ncbi:YqaJ viral recombinase family protein [Mycobacterium sp. TY814]|uniref:YqaJ viral recombinase family protein n=1 Tax=Mycobacterium sp. TY814 TaxID=3050580 RepID=UPI0035319C88